MVLSILRHKVVAHESIEGAAEASCAIPNALGGIDLNEFLEQRKANLINSN